MEQTSDVSLGLLLDALQHGRSRNLAAMSLSFPLPLAGMAPPAFLGATVPTFSDVVMSWESRPLHETGVLMPLCPAFQTAAPTIALTATIRGITRT